MSEFRWKTSLNHTMQTELYELQHDAHSFGNNEHNCACWPVDKAADEGRTYVMALQDQVPEAHLLQLILEILQQVSAHFAEVPQSNTILSYTALNLQLYSQQ